MKLLFWDMQTDRLCLLPKLFSKMYFLLYAKAFDDIMKFEYLKLGFLKNKRSFGSEIKIIFPSFTSILC